MIFWKISCSIDQIVVIFQLKNLDLEHFDLEMSPLYGHYMTLSDFKLICK